MTGRCSCMFVLGRHAVESNCPPRFLPFCKQVDCTASTAVANKHTPHKTIQDCSIHEITIHLYTSLTPRLDGAKTIGGQLLDM